MKNKTTFLFFWAFSSCFLAQSQSSFDVKLDSTTLSYRELATGVVIPWEIAWGADEHIWGTERRGRVFRLNPTTKSLSYVLNIESVIADQGAGEPGLLGMAFHPNFPDSNKVFLVYNYVDASFSIKERLVSYEWDGAKLKNERKLIDNIGGGSIHNGSRLLITKDKKILMTTGDVGSSANSQNMSSILGKVLRINLDGTIPNDNPFPNSYVYSFGHRNAQGLCYGGNGLIYSSEHGAQQDDELNLIEPKRNYGWPNVQGICNTTTEQNFCQANNVKEPLKTWTPCVAVNGLDFYNHHAIPEWKGKLLMAVLGGISTKLPRLSVLTLNGDGTQITAENQYFTKFGRIRDLCINPKTGAIYLATNGPSYPGSGPNKIIEYSNKNLIATKDLNTERWVTIYPNPATTRLGLDFGKRMQGEKFKIYDGVGKLVFSESIQQMYQNIDISNWQAGLYVLVVEGKDGIFSKSFLVVR